MKKDIVDFALAQIAASDACRSQAVKVSAASIIIIIINLLYADHSFFSSKVK